MTQTDQYSIRKKLFEDLFLPDSETAVPDMEILNERYFYQFEQGDFQVLILKLDCGHRKYDNWTIRAVMEEMCASLQRILMKYCFEIELTYVWTETYIICNYPDENAEIFRKELERVVNRFSEMQYLRWGVTFAVGIGSVVKDCRQLLKSMSEAKDAVMERVVFEQRVCLEASETDSIDNFSDIIFWFRAHFDCVMEVPEEDMITEIIEEIERRYNEARHVNGKEFLDAISAMGTYAIVSGMKNDYSKQITQFLRECNSCSDVQQLLWHLAKWLRKIVDNVKTMPVKDADKTMKAAKAYIMNHYTEAITLKTVASYVGFSPCYFSNMFKKKNGIGFSKYLMQLRMDKTKELLIGSRMSVKDICVEVGYNDLKHFTSSFQQYAGYLPGEYRKQFGYK